MRIIGFNFTKVSAEKMKDNLENLKLNTEIDISDIIEVNAAMLKTKETILQINFFYKVKYEPEIAEIDLRGNILLSVEAKQAKEFLKDWKKRKMSEMFRTIIFNLILRKSAPKSMQLEDEMNLPLHLPLPTLRLSKEDKEK